MGSAEHKISTGPRRHLHLMFKQLVPLIQAQVLAAHSRRYRLCFCWREESVHRAQPQRSGFLHRAVGLNVFFIPLPRPSS